MKPLKRPLQRVNYPVLLFTKITGALPSWLFFRPRIYRVPDAPRGKLPGGTLLVSNHTSLLDFVLYLLIFPWNTLRFLIAEVLFSKSTVLSRLLYALGGIFVDRTSHDFSFVADAVRVLQGYFRKGACQSEIRPFPFCQAPSILRFAPMPQLCRFIPQADMAADALALLSARLFRCARCAAAAMNQIRQNWLH